MKKSFVMTFLIREGSVKNLINHAFSSLCIVKYLVDFICIYMKQEM